MLIMNLYSHWVYTKSNIRPVIRLFEAEGEVEWRDKSVTSKDAITPLIGKSGTSTAMEFHSLGFLVRCIGSSEATHAKTIYHTSYIGISD
jgi:hypothetical protein